MFVLFWFVLASACSSSSDGSGGDGGAGAGGMGGQGAKDECSDDSLNDCTEFATCVDNDEGYTCECDFPYMDEGEGCRQVKVLVLSDIEEPANSVWAALDAAGFDAVDGPTYYDWDGLAPSADDMDVILSLEGYEYGNEHTDGANTTIQSFVAAGGGFIRTEWNQYEGYDLDPKLMPVEHYDDYDYESTWTATNPDHPLLREMALPFFSLAGYTYTGVIGAGVSVMENEFGYPIATYTYEHGGTTVYLNHDVHYTTDPIEDEAMKLYLNAVHFAATSAAP